MDDTFCDGHDELYQRAKFGEDRTTRAGCRCENVVFVFVLCFLFLPAGCREAANCRYCFYSQAKIRFFAPQGRLVAPIPVKLCRTDGHLGPLRRAKFHINRRRGVGMRPQKYQNFHFLVKSRPVGATPLTDFQNF